MQNPSNIIYHKVKNKGIQILRAICAVQVLLPHSLNVYQTSIGVKFINTPFHFFFDGQCAVIIFFVLSGFLYYNEKPLTIKSYTRKILSKSLHIFPPYWVSLIIGIFLCNYYLKYNITGNNSESLTQWFNPFWSNKISITDFIQATLVFPLKDSTIINPPSWYLLVEIKMFFIMPLLVNIFNKYSWIYAYLIIIIGLLFAPDNSILNTCGIYTLGASIHKYIKNKDYKISNISNFFYAIIGIFLLNIRNEINIPNHLLFQSIGATLIIYIFFNLQLNTKTITNKILIFIGNISYEIYILHFIFLLMLAPFLTNNTTYLVVATFIITFLISYPLNQINNVLSKKGLIFVDRILNLK